ncbi:MAG: ATP-binding cassette domain-containing protein, partial [Anaerolineae bacterium]
IAGRLPPDSGQIITGATVRLGYYDQEGESLDENRRVLDAVTEIANIIQTAGGKQATAAQMLERFHFPRPVQQAYISTLSGGERRRLTLLRTLMTAPNVLLLDEPTNDLDIQTLSILEDYLEGYNGVLIAVSHDRYFLDRTAAHIIAFEGNGIIRQYPGNYSAYRAKKNAPAPPDEPLPLRPKRAAPSGRRDGAKPRVLNYRETQELANLEEKIAALEGDKIKLAAEINCSGDDYRRLQSLSGALARLEAALDRALERWAELAEIAEG